MNLHLFESLLSRANLTDPFPTSGAHRLNVEEYTEDWSRSIVRNGGFWQGKFTLSTEDRDDADPLDKSEIEDLFYNGLGLHLEEEDAGSVSWEGYVHEVYLSTGNSQMMRSYNDINNHLTAVDNDGNILAISENIDSQLRYGKICKEIKVKTNKCFDSTSTIQEQLDNLLAKTAYPYTKHVSRIAATTESKLEVRVCGYAHTLAWQPACLEIKDVFGTTIDTQRLIDYIAEWRDSNLFNPAPLLGSAIELTDLVRYLVENSPHISEGNIEVSNQLINGEYCDTALSIFDDLIELGGLSPTGSLAPYWRWYVGIGRYLYWERINTETPEYLIQGTGEWSASDGSVISPWRMWPATVDDMAFPTTTAEQGSVFPRSTMFYVDEVTVTQRNGTPDGSPSWRSEKLEEADKIQIVE